MRSAERAPAVPQSGASRLVVATGKEEWMRVAATAPWICDGVDDAVVGGGDVGMTVALRIGQSGCD